MFGLSAAMIAPIPISGDVTGGGVLFSSVMLAAALPLFHVLRWRWVVASTALLGFLEAVALLLVSAGDTGFTVSTAGNDRGRAAADGDRVPARTLARPTRRDRLAGRTRRPRVLHPVHRRRVPVRRRPASRRPLDRRHGDARRRGGVGRVRGAAVCDPPAARQPDRSDRVVRAGRGGDGHRAAARRPGAGLRVGCGGRIAGAGRRADRRTQPDAADPADAGLGRVPGAGDDRRADRRLADVRASGAHRRRIVGRVDRARGDRAGRHRLLLRHAMGAAAGARGALAVARTGDRVSARVVAGCRAGGRCLRRDRGCAVRLSPLEADDLLAARRHGAGDRRRLVDRRSGGRARRHLAGRGSGRGRLVGLRRPRGHGRHRRAAGLRLCAGVVDPPAAAAVGRARRAGSGGRARVHARRGARDAVRHLVVAGAGRRAGGRRPGADRAARADAVAADRRQRRADRARCGHGVGV